MNPELCKICQINPIRIYNRNGKITRSLICAKCDYKKYTKGINGKNNNQRYLAKKKGHVPYEISKEEYDKLHLQQNGKCKLCEKDEKENGRALSIDHCHKTGKIRGLLCNNCNLVLGFFKDDNDIINKFTMNIKNYLD